MQRRHLTLSLLATAALGACAGGGPQGLALAPNSTLIVTRHGDRDGAEDVLNKTGQARARALVTATRDLGLAHVTSPGINRNIETATPLARALDLPITRIPQEAPTAELIRLAAIGPTIWVGNKGNIARIWRDLGLPEDSGPLDYGDLHILRSDATGKMTIARRRYRP